MRKSTLDGIELLAAIDRAGSFSGAGLLPNQATPTVSRAVGKREHEPGAVLCHRDGPRIVCPAWPSRWIWSTCGITATVRTSTSILPG